MSQARKAGLIFSVIVGMAALPFLSRPAFSRGRDQKAVLGVYRDEGNTGIPFSTACTGSAWTQVASTDSIRRAWLIQVSTLATTSVFLATTTNSGDVPSDSLPHVELQPGSAFSEYDGVNWQCRTRGGGTVNIFGYWTRDVGDYGAAGDRR